MEMQHKYINPLTDFGFKRIFGTEANVDLLIDFLNTVLPLKSPIVNLTFQNVEQIPNGQEDRKAVYDLFCHNEKGDEFIIEMQKGKLQYFKDRGLYYVSFPIQKMGQRGEWNFQLDPLFYLSIMDFLYEPKPIAQLERRVQFKDDDNVVFYDKLLMMYIQLPAFDKNEEELVTRKDQWYYFLKNLENMEENIVQLFKNDKIFSKMITVAEIAKLSPDEFQNYSLSRLQYMEIKGVADTAFMEGELAAEEKFVAMIEEERKQKEEERKQKEEERKQKEEERKQKEEAKAKAEEERKQKEEERKQKEEALLQSKNAARKMLEAGMSKEYVASMFSITFEELEGWVSL